MKIIFLFCLGLASISFASEELPVGSLRHSYVVPLTFKNDETYLKTQERLMSTGVLYVIYESNNVANKNQCMRTFYPDGKVIESYYGQNGLFPDGARVPVNLQTGMRSWPTFKYQR